MRFLPHDPQNSVIGFEAIEQAAMALRTGKRFAGLSGLTVDIIKDTYTVCTAFSHTQYNSVAPHLSHTSPTWASVTVTVLLSVQSDTERRYTRP